MMKIRTSRIVRNKNVFGNKPEKTRCAAELFKVRTSRNNTRINSGNFDVLPDK